jgi:hypothetical protein
MSKPAATWVSPLERRVFIGMTIADIWSSAALLAYVQIYPAEREVVSLIWGAVLFAATATYWVIRRREIRRRGGRDPGMTA